MKKAPMTKKSLSNKPKKKLTGKELIITLAKLVAKDAAKAKFGPKSEKQIARQLGQVLEEVDAHLPDALAVYCNCSNGEYITAANCYLLGCHCTD